MKRLLGQLWRVLLITFCGVAGSVSAGLMRYGGDVLIINSLPFLFVAYGLTGGCVFAVYNQWGPSNAMTSAVVLAALQFLVSAGWIPTINAAIWSFGVNTTIVLLAFLFERKLSYLKHAKSIVVGLLVGVVFVLLTLMVSLLSHITRMPASAFRENFLDGALMGLGLGLGIDLGESVVHSFEMHWSGEASPWPTHRGGTGS